MQQVWQLKDHAKENQKAFARLVSNTTLIPLYLNTTANFLS